MLLMPAKVELLNFLVSWSSFTFANKNVKSNYEAQSSNQTMIIILLTLNNFKGVLNQTNN